MSDDWSRPKRDVREYEYTYLINVFKMLSLGYKGLIGLESYKHPIMGERYSVIYKDSGEVFDLERILSVTIDFENNLIRIQMDCGTKDFRDVIKDQTVIVV